MKQREFERNTKGKGKGASSGMMSKMPPQRRPAAGQFVPHWITDPIENRGKPKGGAQSESEERLRRLHLRMYSFRVFTDDPDRA